TTHAERAQRAGELARLYEHELGDVDAAVRVLVAAQTTAPDEAHLKELMRMLRGAQRWGELAQLLERELQRPPSGDAQHHVNLLPELGELRAERLGRTAEAAQAFEAALERDAKNPIALERLERLYEQLGRDRELARLLEARADVTADKPARSALLARVAALRS